MPPTPPRIVVAFPFTPEQHAAFRAAAGDAFTVQVVDPADDAAFNRALGPGCIGLVAQRVPAPGSTPDLRWHQVMSAGVEHLLKAGPWPEGVLLTNAAGAYAVPIAQYVLGAILRVSEHLDARQALQDRRAWPDPVDPFTGIPVRGRTVVVVGYGGIGREVARVCAALGMRVLAVTARPDRRIDHAYREPGTGDPDGSIPERTLGTDGMAEAFAEADFVASTAPLTPATRGMIGAAALAALPAHAWIINTGRGAVIDRVALEAALRARRIGGAVLDVFDPEPLPADDPLWTLPNVIITPHVSGAAAPGPLGRIVAENIARLRDGRPLINQVDPARGY